MTEMFFEDSIDDTKYLGHLYGLGTNHGDGKAPGAGLWEATQAPTAGEQGGGAKEETPPPPLRSGDDSGKSSPEKWEG